MKDFFEDLIILLYFILSIIMFYLSFSMTILFPIGNIIMFLAAIFVLMKGSDKLDKELGIGEYYGTNSKNVDNDEQKS